MKQQKNKILLLIIGFLPILLVGQKMQTNLFLRTPQVVNYNFNQQEIAYNQVVSIGVGLARKSEFIELASYITEDNNYGFYTFFGTTLKTVILNENWNFYTNWFGEVTYTPKQITTKNYFAYTSGLCFLLNRNFNWGSVGIPLCIGILYSQKNISLNTRTILNISLKLN